MLTLWVEFKPHFTRLQEHHRQAQQALLVSLNPLIKGKDVGEPDGVVNFQFVWSQISPLGQLWEKFHADCFALIVELGLPPFVVLHRNKVFPLLSTNFTALALFLVKEARAHQLVPLRYCIIRT